MRTKIDWRSSSKENYNNFCNKNPTVKVTFDQWKNIILDKWVNDNSDDLNNVKTND